MRSLRYLIGGKPHNFDDCIDFTRKEAPKNVSLELIAKETVTEMFILKQVIGVYRWTFPSAHVKYDEIYSGFFLHEREKKQIKRIDDANKRLRIVKEKINISGIVFDGKEKLFDYSYTGQNKVENVN